MWWCFINIYRATKNIYQWTILGEQGLDLVGDVQSKPEIEKWVNDKGARWSEKHHLAHYTPPSGTEAGAGFVKDHVAVTDELFCVREECKKVLCIKRRRWSISFCGRSGPGGGATGGTCVDSILWATIHHYPTIHYPARMTMENLQQAQEWPSAGWPVNAWSSGNVKDNFVSTVGALRRPMTNDELRWTKNELRWSKTKRQ